MYLRIYTLIVCLLLVGLLHTSTAQPLTKGQIKADQKNIVKDKQAVADDRRDLDRLSDLVLRWDTLRKESPNSPELEAVQSQIAAELRRDLKETSRDAAKAAGEVKKSKLEVKRSKRELKREIHDGDRDKLARKDDKRDLRDDRRDKRDDVKDAAQMNELKQKKEQVARELVGLQKQIDQAGQAGDKLLQEKQAKLLEDYLALSQEEIRLGIREIKEDRQERREDVKEKKEGRLKK